MQSILEKFVRHIDNFSIRKKMIFIYIFCMLLPITLTDGVIIYTVLHTEAQLRRSEMEDIADAVNYQIFYDVDTVSKVAKSIYANQYINDFLEIIYVFLTIFLYLLKCPQSLILSALRAFCFCGKPHISRSIFLYFRYQAWLKSW